MNRKPALFALAISFFVISLCAAKTQLADLPTEAVEHMVLHVPESSVEQPGDQGVRAHTNHVIMVRPDRVGAAPKLETPASIGCIYRTVSSMTAGCPQTGSVVPAGGSGTIAIVGAFDYPTAENDLGVFSARFGLPPCTTGNGCFKVVYATGIRPRANCGWSQEAALDIQWAHAMAPGAKIVLVEAASNSLADLMVAVDKAGTLASGGQVSMSWGGSEFSGETAYDSHFKAPGVVYLAASGDQGGKTIYPGVSPNVISCGGTTLHRDAAGNFLTETGWSGSGGGYSQYEGRPSYQDSLSGVVGGRRGTPDVALVADPSTGVAVYDSGNCQGLSGWMTFGGTSVAAPAWAGILNLAGHRSVSSADELALIYSGLGSSAFRDITSGQAGAFVAASGWDYVTGVGSNQGLGGK